MCETFWKPNKILDLVSHSGVFDKSLLTQICITSEQIIKA